MRHVWFSAGGTESPYFGTASKLYERFATGIVVVIVLAVITAIAVLTGLG